MAGAARRNKIGIETIKSRVPDYFKCLRASIKDICHCYQRDIMFTLNIFGKTACVRCYC